MQEKDKGDFLTRSVRLPQELADRLKTVSDVTIITATRLIQLGATIVVELHDENGSPRESFSQLWTEAAKSRFEGKEIDEVISKLILEAIEKDHPGK